MKTVPHCRFCDTPLTATLCDLGDTLLANSYVTQAQTAQERDRKSVV